MRLLLLALIATVSFACSWDYQIWIPRSQSADPLYRFIKNRKAGYIDRNGQVVIPPRLEAHGNYGSEFHDGLLEIAVDGGRYVDRTGRVVINSGLYRGWSFSEGLAVAMRKGEELWGYINTLGQFTMNSRFETYPNGYVFPFSDGLARIEVQGRFGYIDHSGQFVIKPQLLDGIDFSDGMARVVTEGPCVYSPDGPCGAFNPRFVGGKVSDNLAQCKFTFIDKTGRIITRSRFRNARNFSEGVAPVQVGELWGFIDKNASMVIAPKFEDAQPFSSGLTRIQVHGLYGYAEKTGSIKINPRYKYAEDFSEGFAVVGDGGGHYWFINQNNIQTIPGEFEAASPFFKGLAHVKLLASDADKSQIEFAYIDAKGHRVFTY